MEERSLNYRQLIGEQGRVQQFRIHGQPGVDEAFFNMIAIVISSHPRVMKEGESAEYSDPILDIFFRLKTGSFEIYAQNPKGKRRRKVMEVEKGGRVIIFVTGFWVKHLTDIVLPKAQKN